ncbi:MAG: hypothetical protein ABIH46_08995 [Chloroflexota bacterium]
MPRGDYRHREPKKQKKTAKKSVVPLTILPTPVAAEVVQKKKKPREETEEQG